MIKLNSHRDSAVKGQQKSHDMRSGFSVFDFVIWLALASVVIGGIVVAQNSANDSLDANGVKSDYNLVMKAAKQYYQNNYAYPKGAGWVWNAGGIYLDSKVEAKGWTYNCAVSTMTITTPAITDVKTRTKLQQAFALNSDGVAVSGESLAITLNDSPCP